MPVKLPWRAALLGETLAAQRRASPAPLDSSYEIQAAGSSGAYRRWAAPLKEQDRFTFCRVGALYEQCHRPCDKPPASSVHHSKCLHLQALTQDQACL